MNKEPLLKIEDLTIAFKTDEGIFDITDRVCLEIFPGEIFGLVGESGCGKTVTALSILRLLPKPGSIIKSGKIYFNGRDLLSLSPDEIKKIRGREITMIFQEPAAALNPLLTIKKQLMEFFEYHEITMDKDQRVKELLRHVGFPDPQRILSCFPHELSGGMLQRVIIAMALLLNPSLIIADEPTTALDVTVQAQILELLVQMQKETQTSILFITHNISLIAQYADRVAVMYAGRIVEESPLDTFLGKPRHPYSKGLMDALPDLNSKGSELRSIPGQVPQPRDYVSGCRFNDRCLQAFDQCVNKPVLAPVDDHFQKVACFLYRKDTDGHS